MTTIELYEKSGKPRRATVKLSAPTKVYTGKRRASIVTKFDAYLTVVKGEVVYYLNPNAHHAFYLPENVTEFAPVDTMELWYRARKAADHIKADRIHGRELDDAFENCDGDEMCAALWRMAQKSEKLMAAIRKAWKDHGVRDTFETNAAKYATLTDKELSQRAAETRERFSHPSAWITE